MSSQGKSVVILGGGFAGIACAKALAKERVRVTLVDRHNYHQFQPMLYQVATAQLAASDVAMPLRAIFRRHKNVFVKMGDVVEVDPREKLVRCSDGTTFAGDYIVLAMGTQPNFFNIPGAAEHAFPLYSLKDADKLRSRVFSIFEEADRNQKLIDQGVLNIVIVGAGATGVETAGAIAGLVKYVMPGRFHQLQVNRTRIHLVDPADVVLGPFSTKCHEYTSRVLRERGVRLELGVSVSEVRADGVTLSDGREIATHTVVWAGGIQAAELASNAGIQQVRGGRLGAQRDLSVDGFPGVYTVGDVSNVLDNEGKPFPQLGSVAMQQGKWCGQNILADIDGRESKPFHYRDKGIMAVIGRNAAVAEMGKRRREVHGFPAFLAWIFVHVWLLTGIRQRINALMSWMWDYFSSNRAPSVIDETDLAAIDTVQGQNANTIDLREKAKVETPRSVRSK